MLHDLVSRSAARRPEATAVSGAGGTLSYAELDARANQMARKLSRVGVGAGDRVAIWLPKSAEAVAAMQGVLRLGAAYVPIDALTPALRARALMLHCKVRALLASPQAGASVLDAETRDIHVLAIEGDRSDALDGESCDPVPAPKIASTDLAYILYTSGSTGHPKGVCISHSNATAFVDWAVGALGARESDRFSNHAPFHFDLSVLDIYAAFAAGAAVCLAPEGAAFAAEHLARFIRDERITVWYSVPSALVLMIEHGGLLSGPPDPLRAVLFAGEVFPMKHLRRMREAWPGVAMWNLYGPTETNVCTAYEVRDVDTDCTAIPIGRAVCGDQVWARRADGEAAQVGEEGELMAQGPTVFAGYWGRPPRPEGPYATGDFVRVAADGVFHFVGRRDHMVKVRGHRIELGEIETALLRHASVREAVAVVVGEGLAARVVVFLGTNSVRPPTLLDVKRLCAERLPRYMIPDEAVSMPELPRNPNGKVDRRALASALEPRAPTPRGE